MAARRKTTRRRGPVNTTRDKSKLVYDGIKFQSLLEITMYKLLKDSGIDFKYEPKPYVTFRSFTSPNPCYERATKRSKGLADRRKVTQVSYTPDFVCANEEWFIEVKGRANESFPIRWKLFKKMLQETNPDAMIFKPMNKKDCEEVVEILKLQGYGN